MAESPSLIQDGPRVVHMKRDPFDVYIGRPSKWGNPFSHKDDTLAEFKVATRDEAVDAYAVWIKDQPDLMADLHELRGKTLGCWCAPRRCHGDVLLALAKDALLVGKHPRKDEATVPLHD